MKKGFIFAHVIERHNAKIAQLVEHDLAKVGVAGSSPVSRSADASPREASLFCDAPYGEPVHDLRRYRPGGEMADTRDLKSLGP